MEQGCTATRRHGGLTLRTETWPGKVCGEVGPECDLELVSQCWKPTQSSGQQRPMGQVAAWQGRGGEAILEVGAGAESAILEAQPRQEQRAGGQGTAPRWPGTKRGRSEKARDDARVSCWRPSGQKGKRRGSSEVQWRTLGSRLGAAWGLRELRVTARVLRSSRRGLCAIASELGVMGPGGE